MADHRKATEDGLVYFNRPQLITVSSLFVAGFVVVFFLGILIGQSIEERKLLRTEGQAVRVPVESGAPKDEQDMTFYETLTTPKPPPATEISPDPKPSRDPKPSAQGRTEGDPAPWTVQVFASRSRSTADDMVAKLRRQGYGAYMVSVQLNDRTFYRVRVGRYGSRQDAMGDLERLKAANFKNAEITRSR